MRLVIGSKSMGVKMNRKNLKKLADYLESENLKAEFDMQYFENMCGSAVCAIGHAPYAGIPKKPNEDWVDYSQRVFDIRSVEWIWCFSEGWSKSDNSPQGAAKRINWLLNHGLPEDNWFEQMKGQAELCYE